MSARGRYGRRNIADSAEVPPAGRGLEQIGAVGVRGERRQMEIATFRFYRFLGSRFLQFLPGASSCQDSSADLSNLLTALKSSSRVNGLVM